jgi:hypothetical protein
MLQMMVKPPSTKTKETESFLCVVICSRQTKGIGMKRRMKSNKTFEMATPL